VADIIYLQVAGGAVMPHDAPLHWAIQEQLDKGYVARVNEDGTPWVAPEPEPAADPDEVPAGSVAVVLAWVGEDREKAMRALEAENAADKPRTTLVTALEALATEPTE
jgi:NACalpha-BTF3-like transcription factor